MKQNITVALVAAGLSAFLLVGCTQPSSNDTSNDPVPTATVTMLPSQQPTNAATTLPVQWPKDVPLANSSYVPGSIKQYSNTASQMEYKTSVYVTDESLETVERQLKEADFTTTMNIEPTGAKFLMAENETYYLTVYNGEKDSKPTLDYRIVVKAVN
jgi:hypothetical protein